MISDFAILNFHRLSFHLFFLLFQLFEISSFLFSCIHFSTRINVLCHLVNSIFSLSNYHFPFFYHLIVTVYFSGSLSFLCCFYAHYCYMQKSRHTRIASLPPDAIFLQIQNWYRNICSLKDFNIHFNRAKRVSLMMIF